MTMHHYAIYEAATGKVIAKGGSTDEAIIGLAQAGLLGGQALYVGDIDPNTMFLPGGFPAPLPEASNSVVARDVKAHAGRILSYSDWVDIRSINGPAADPEMLAYRQAVRDASNEIEAMDPIPSDFRDPKYWPVSP